MSTGFVLNIPQEMINRLDLADQKIERLAKTSEDAQTRIVSAFKSINAHGIDAFIQKLDEAQQKLAQLGGTQINMGVNAGTGGIQQLVDAMNKLSQASKTNITINGLGTIGGQSQTAVDAINKLMTTLQQLQQMGGQQLLGGVNILGRETLKEMNKEAKKMGKTLEKLDEATQKYGMSANELADKLRQARQAQQQFNDLAKQQAQSDVSGLIGQKGQQRTLNELKNYANELKRTMANLDPKSEDWAKLNGIYRQTNREIKNIQNSMKDAQKTSRGLMDIGGQLARRLALVFSVSQITGYVKKLIEVRGEFELQQRSLQAILQNKDEADRIWKQTVDLAVRSPFRVKELVSYTKQLAAYRIESDKLFETNKMLADISAGLGVDMQRLILAFGQVRSAAYLRGTELRQFTEAGIPILEQLADYFTELEGRAVSVGDVFERVSKRMVSFADVEEIFKRMTSEGGTFYRMQEIQAETLQGQISNLKDSVDIMLNDIGKAHQETLKEGIAIVRSVVQNWRLLATAIQQAAAALVGFNAVKIVRTLRLSGDALEDAVLKSKGLTAATAKLKTSMLDLGRTIKAHPYIFAAALAASAIHALVQYGKSVDAMNAKYDEMSQRELRRVDTLKGLNEQVERNNQAIKDSLEQQGKASEGTSEYADAEDSLSRARGKNISLLNRLKKEYPEVYASIVVQKDGTIDLTKAIEEQNKVAQRQIALQQQAKGGFFQQDFSTNYEDAVEALGKYSGALEAVRTEAYKTHESLVNALNLGEISQESFDAMVGLIDQLKSAKDLSTVRDILKQLNTTIGGADDLSFKFISNIQRATQGLSDSFVDYTVSLGNFRANIVPMTTTIGNAVREMIALDPVQGEENAKEYIDKVLAEFGVLNSTVKEWARDEIVKLIKVKLVWGEDTTDEGDDELTEDWAKRVKEAVDKINEEIKKKSPQIEDLFPVPNKNQTKEEYLAVAKDAIKVAETTYNEMQKIEEQGTVDRAKALAPFADEYRKILNLFKESGNGGRDAVAERLKNQISLIKEMNQEYEKLLKTFSKEEAASRVLNAYGKTAKQLGLDISKMDFSDGGTIASLEKLLGDPQYKAQKYALDIQKALDNYQVELDVDIKKGRDKEMVDQVQELFDRYNLSLELKKLNIPPELSKSLFDVDYLDLEGLKAAVQEQESKFIGTDMEDEYKKFLEKIDDMEDKAAKERMKTYVKYLMEGMSERVKLKIEELRKLKEIEESDEFSPEQKKRIKEGVSKEARAEQQKQEWKDFQGSEMYTMMFEDLEHYGSYAIDILYNKLNELRDQLNDLPASEVKEIVGQIEKLENIKIERNPFESWKKYAQEVKNIGFSEEELQKQLLDSQSAEAAAQQYIDIYNTIMQSLQSEDEGVFEQVDAETLAQWTEMLRLADEQGKSIEEILAAKKLVVEESKKEQGEITDNLRAYKKLSKAQKESYELIQEWLGQIGNIFSSSKELMESLGVESDSVAMTIADTGSSMVSLIQSAIQFTLQLQLMGIAANSALGVIGWIAIAIQAVATVLTAIFTAKDKALQKQVEANLDTVKALQEKYETLEDSIDNAWDTASIREYNRELKTTTQAMINAQKAAIAAQSQRKGANKEGSDAYNELQDMKAELKELEAQLEESLADSFSKVTDGILDSVHDAAKEFTDAWWDAFVETGDGLSGLEENFNEMFLNLAKNQAAMQITGAFADRWKRDLEKYINADDTELTKEEAQKWAEEVRRTLPELSNALEGYLGAFKDMAEETEGTGLSALQKGIQGVTEETAQVLEALLNSMRFYVADSNAKLTILLNSFLGGESESPMLVELRTQTKWMRDIYNLINGMTAAHPNGGRGIKTVM